MKTSDQGRWRLLWAAALVVLLALTWAAPQALARSPRAVVPDVQPPVASFAIRSVIRG